MRNIYLTDYCNSGQKTEEEYNRTSDMMAHSRKQQGQYRKIIKDDNPVSSSVSSIPSSTVLSVHSSTVHSVPTSTVPSIPSSSVPWVFSSTVPSVPSSSTPSTSLSSSFSSTYLSSTSSKPVIPMPDDQFKELMT